jgi:hypothetical protein
LNDKIGLVRNDPANDLRVVADATLRFRSDRRWIDVKHFAFTQGRSNLDLLSELVAHLQFRDAYLGSGPRDVDVHGPYHLSAVTPDKYEPTDTPTALNWVDSFCLLFDAPPPRPLDQDIDAVLRARLKPASAIFRLPVLEGSEHEDAWILEEFRELVIISHEFNELSLVVMGID